MNVVIHTLNNTFITKMCQIFLTYSQKRIKSEKLSLPSTKATKLDWKCQPGEAL